MKGRRIIYLPPGDRYPCYAAGANLFCFQCKCIGFDTMRFARPKVLPRSE